MPGGTPGPFQSLEHGLQSSVTVLTLEVLALFGVNISKGEN